MRPKRAVIDGRASTLTDGRNLRATLRIPSRLRGTAPFTRRYDRVTPRTGVSCGSTRVTGILLWLIGIPIPVIILLYIFVFK